jgi:hypothetical protein
MNVAKWRDRARPRIDSNFSPWRANGPIGCGQQTVGLANPSEYLRKEPPSHSEPQRPLWFEQLAGVAKYESGCLR